MVCVTGCNVSREHNLADKPS